VRRAYRQFLPVLARHFPGWDWSRIEEMPGAEIAEFMHQLQEILDPLDAD
jgi:hypothetical protein